MATAIQATPGGRHLNPADYPAPDFLLHLGKTSTQKASTPWKREQRGASPDSSSSVSVADSSWSKDPSARHHPDTHATTICEPDYSSSLFGKGKTDPTSPVTRADDGFDTVKSTTSESRSVFMTPTSNMSFIASPEVPSQGLVSQSPQTMSDDSPTIPAGCLANGSTTSQGEPNDSTPSNLQINADSKVRTSFESGQSDHCQIPNVPGLASRSASDVASTIQLESSMNGRPTVHRAITLGGSHVKGSGSRQDASSSRLPPSPTRASRIQRAYSYDPAIVAKSSVQSRKASGDEFQDEVARQADAIRRERQSRKIEEEEKGKQRASEGGDEKHLVLVGNLIGEGHVNYVMMYNMLTGIRIGVSRCQAKLKRPLTDDDYSAKHKFSFDVVGNELTPSAKYDFKFKDYAPWVFREMREYFHLDPADYLLSLTAKYILSELGSPGKSGSFFYFSRDYRFIIKTIHHSEHKFLLKILREYHEHIKKNPHTLLSRFYGLHRVKLPHGRKIHFVIMNNLFPPHRDIHETFDLKGSAIGREYPEDKAAQKTGAVLKDLNWVRRGRVLDLGPEKKALFEEQLKRDTALLQRLGIMDYSLLIGCHDVNRGNRDKLRDDQLKVFQPDTAKVRRPTQVRRDQEKTASALRKAIQQSDPKALSEKHRLPDKDQSERRHFIFYQDEGGYRATADDNSLLATIYYLGIIDILTPYSAVKSFEHMWKGLSHDKHMISAVPPKEYGNRFLNFLSSIIRGGDVSLRPKGLEPEPT